MPEESLSIEHDHFPQVADRAMRRVEALGLKEKLSHSSSRRELFKTANNEDYKKILGYINSITRGAPIEYDYQKGSLPLEEIPPAEDKERFAKSKNYNAKKGVFQNRRPELGLFMGECDRKKPHNTT